MLISVTDGDLADHDAHLGGETTKHLSSHDDQAQAIAATLLRFVFHIYVLEFEEAKVVREGVLLACRSLFICFISNSL